MTTIGRSENKGLTLFAPFEDEARPGVVNILQRYFSRGHSPRPNRIGWSNLATLSKNKG